ncbi:7343_t:CDS:2 [Entrophospora sp. SA101]|nr:7343_t:CDS:2 [Entrophospora sp. SA101]
MKMMIQEISDSPKINTLPSPITNAFELFKNACNVTLDFENKYFENKIELIQNCREDFHLIANDTIQRSYELAKFRGCIMDLIKYHGDKNVPDKDILDYLNKLLGVANANKSAIKKTNFEIITLKDEMINIRNELAEFDFENAKNIDPTTYNNLNDAGSKKKFLDEIINEICPNMSATGKELTGKAVEKAVELAAGAVITKVSGAGAVTAKLVGTAGAAKVLVVGTAKVIVVVGVGTAGAAVAEILSTRQGQMIKKSKILQKNVFSVSQCLNDLKEFWESQIAQLESLITEFKSLNSSNEQRIIKLLEKQWKKTIKEYV